MRLTFLLFFFWFLHYRSPNVLTSCINQKTSSGSSRSKRKYEVLIGTRSFMFENSIVVSDNVETTMQSHEGKGRTSVLVAIDSKWYLLDFK